MHSVLCLMLLLGSVETSPIAAPAAKPAPLPPIMDVAVKPNAQAFKDANRKAPIVIKSDKELAAYFDKKQAKVVAKQVDFNRQIVLVFAWRGSGQDRLTFGVNESFPEQIEFNIKPGRTRDLRPHTHVYVLRSNVRWSVR